MAGTNPIVGSGIQGLAGMSMDNVRVHQGGGGANAQGAQAFTKGSDIQFKPGQDKLLAHEATHVVQQKQGAVKPVGGPSGLPAEHVLQSKGLSSKGAAEVAKGSAPSSSADQAMLRGSP